MFPQPIVLETYPSTGTRRIIELFRLFDEIYIFEISSWESLYKLASGIHTKTNPFPISIKYLFIHYHTNFGDGHLERIKSEHTYRKEFDCINVVSVRNPLGLYKTRLRREHDRIPSKEALIKGLRDFKLYVDMVSPIVIPVDALYDNALWRVEFFNELFLNKLKLKQSYKAEAAIQEWKKIGHLEDSVRTDEEIEKELTSFKGLFFSYADLVSFYRQWYTLEQNI